MIGLNIRDKSSIDFSLHDCSRQPRISSRMAFAALAEMAGVKLTKSLPHRVFDFLDETYNQENRISGLGHSLAGLRPCNRQSSSSPDEAPADTPEAASLQHSELPQPRVSSCNARWHHRHTSQTADAETAAPSTHRTHNAETDSLTAD